MHLVKCIFIQNENIQKIEIDSLNIVTNLQDICRDKLRCIDMYMCVLFQSKISRLPAYLTIQFVRFYYKEKEAINAKILKDVKFPLEFDAFELCSPELQSKLVPMREKFKEYEDSLVEESCNAKAKDTGNGIKKKIKQEPFWFKNGKSMKKKLSHKFRILDIEILMYLYCRFGIK